MQKVVRFFLSVAEQGDQIGRILAHWVIVYFWQFFEKYRSSPNILPPFFCSLSDLIHFEKNVPGLHMYNLGDFFANTSEASFFKLA
jgi:hypothetical protein